MAKHKRLGKGLGALLTASKTVTLSGKMLMTIELSQITPNPRQPRQQFNEKSLKELSSSIERYGLAQPLLVRKISKNDNEYELIAGERRLRAAKLAGLKKVPVVVKELSDEESLEIALVENLQREDLNPIDEATSYKKLIDEFNLTQEEISKKIAKSRSAVANTLRLLDLPEEIKNALRQGQITAGHGRALLAIQDEREQKKVFKEMLAGALNVRQAEAISKAKKKSSKKKPALPFVLNEESQKLSSLLGTKVSIQGSTERGHIFIHYFSQEDLERILELIKK